MTHPDDHALWLAWSELARRAYAVHPEYTASAAAAQRHRQAVVDFICRGRISGVVRARWYSDAAGGTRLGAALATYPEPDSWYGVARRPIMFNRDADDPGAVDWLVEQIRDVGVGPETDVFVFDADRPMVDRLLTACPGLGIDSVVLLGDVAPCLAALKAERDPASMQARGFSMGPLAGMGDVDRLVGLTRDVFAAHPGWCWFGTTGLQLARERQGLMRSIGGGDPDDLTEAIRHDGEVVGMVQAHIEDNPLWGRLAGVGLLLDPRFWGQGLLGPMYRRLLERLAAAGVQRIKGGTSQPPVMRLARLMGRPVHGVHLRYAAAFPRRHFDPILGPAAPPDSTESG